MEKRFALVLNTSVNLDPQHWRASKMLDSCGPERVQFDGTVVLIPRHRDDVVCGRATAVHTALGTETDAVIVALADRRGPEGPHAEGR